MSVTDGTVLDKRFSFTEVQHLINDRTWGVIFIFSVIIKSSVKCSSVKYISLYDPATQQVLENVFNGFGLPNEISQKRTEEHMSLQLHKSFNSMFNYLLSFNSDASADWLEAYDGAFFNMCGGSLVVVHLSRFITSTFNCSFLRKTLPLPLPRSLLTLFLSY